MRKHKSLFFAKELNKSWPFLSLKSKQLTFLQSGKKKEAKALEDESKPDGGDSEDDEESSMGFSAGARRRGGRKAGLATHSMLFSVCFW